MAVRNTSITLTKVSNTSVDNAQQLCAYETVSLGFSHWCSLFTYEEWKGFEYCLDIAFAGGYGFVSNWKGYPFARRRPTPRPHRRRRAKG